MKSPAIALSAAVLLACSGAIGWWVWSEKFSPEAKHKALVKGILKDPESTNFKFVRQSKRDPDTWCGEMNARNSMGGMVGFKRYVFTSPRDLGPEDVQLFRLLSKFVEDGDSTFNGRWSAFCE